MAAPIQFSLGTSPLSFGSSCDGANARIALVLTESQPTGVSDEDGSYTIQGGHSATIGVYVSYWLLRSSATESGTRAITVSGGGFNYAVTGIELSGDYSSGAATPTRTDQSSGGGSPYDTGALTATADGAIYIGMCIDLSGNSTDIDVDSPATEGVGAATFVVGYYEQSTVAAFNMTGDLVGSGVFWGATLGVFNVEGGSPPTSTIHFDEYITSQFIMIQ